MKFTVLSNYFFGSISLVCLLLTSCNQPQKKEIANTAISKVEIPLTKTMPKKPLSEAFKKYWYAGNAEITSYELQQARYGEIRKGSAVLIYVTEPFLNDKQVKADYSNADNIQVLKLNATKNYLTGIYPYSIMSSTFYPVYDNQHAVKTSFSAQEWCGHVYAQINNREQFEFTSHSYFESEADEKKNLEKAHLENEIWNKIRINPTELPQGELQMIPSLEYIRLSHKKLKAYPVMATLTTANSFATYQIDYPDLDRSLSITFSTEFPHTIESWKEEFVSGFGTNAKKMTSSGSKIKQLKTKYWGQNSNADLDLRDSLGL